MHAMDCPLDPTSNSSTELIHTTQVLDINPSSRVNSTAITRCKVSPIPMGHTPGHLSKAINLLETKAHSYVIPGNNSVTQSMDKNSNSIPQPDTMSTKSEKSIMPVTGIAATRANTTLILIIIIITSLRTT